jgi:cyanophycin synthetase
MSAALHRTNTELYDDEQALARTYERIWQSAAEAVGAEVEDLGKGFLAIRRAGVETLVRRNLAMIDHPVSVTLAVQKSFMAWILVTNGVPVAEQMDVHRGDIATAAERIATGGGRWVVKPASGIGGGYGITCGVETTDDLFRAWLWAAVFTERIIVERQVEGEEFRLLYLDGELLDAVHRVRPTVTGDGRSTVAELIATENRRRLTSGTAEVGRFIKIDLDCELALRQSGLTLRSVVAPDVRVPVKGSVADNCAADNTTARDLSPRLVQSGARAARLARLRLAGVDIVTPDPTRSLEETGGVVLEVNATPGLQHHYMVRDPAHATPVASTVLERILQECAAG